MAAIKLLTYALCLAAGIIFPLFALAGSPGIVAGAVLSLSLWIGLGWHATRRVENRLHLLKLPFNDHQRLEGTVLELSRRIHAESPQLRLLPAKTINVIAFGWNAKDGIIALSQGALDNLKDDELAASLGWAITSLNHPETALNLWSSQFIHLWERILVPQSLKKSSALTWLLRLLAFPWFTLTFLILKPSMTTEAIDARSIKLSRLPLALAEALKAMEVSASRNPLTAPISTERFFMHPPLNQQSVSHWLLENRRLVPRVQMIQKSFFSVVSP